MRAGESEGRFVKSDERMLRVCVVSSGAEDCVAPFCFFKGYNCFRRGMGRGFNQSRPFP
jgi:hypothetical protein